MSYAQIAERYGRAIFELGSETGELQTLTDQLRRLASTYRDSKDLQQTFADPGLSEAVRRSLVDELAAKLGLSTQAKNAVLLLAERHRLGALPEIAARVSTLADEKNGILRVKLSSAEPLAESYSAQLVQQLEQSTGRRVVVEKQVDPSLIAGVVATIGDNTIDGSLSGRLREIEQQLLAGS
jgi:F-type H+-transporting ATPase subunit delta